MKQIRGAMPRKVKRPHTHILTFFLIFIVASDVARAVGINNVPVTRIRGDKPALSTSGDEPILRSNYTFLAPARDSNVRVVLLRTVDVIWISVVRRDMIKLRGRLIVQSRPGLAAIHRNAGAAVVGVADSIRIFRINPGPVRVA